jgi:hypothetical protein
MDPAALLVAACNGALAHLDQPPITSLDQDMHAARTLKSLWRGVLDECLVEHNWNFAESDFTPAAESLTADTKGWYRHPLPENCLQIVAIEGLDADEWKVVAPANPDAVDAAQARRLFSKVRSPSATATWRIENAGLWSPLFRSYFELKLAAKAAGPVARAAGKASDLRAEAKALLPTAKKRDGQEQAPRQVRRDTSWIAARRRGFR